MLPGAILVVKFTKKKVVGLRKSGMYPLNLSAYKGKDYETLYNRTFDQRRSPGGSVPVPARDSNQSAKHLVIPWLWSDPEPADPTG